MAPVCKDLPEHVVLLMAETHRRFIVIIVVLFLIDHVLRLHHLLVVFRHFLVCIPLPNLLVNPLLFLRGTAAINNNITSSSSSSSRATEATLQSFCGGRIGLEPPGPKGVEETQEGLFGHFLLSRPRRSLLLVLGTALHSLLLGGCRCLRRSLATLPSCGVSSCSGGGGGTLLWRRHSEGPHEFLVQRLLVLLVPR